MFARAYPLNRERILNEVCSGIISSIKMLPIDIGLKIIENLLCCVLDRVIDKLYQPSDPKEREKYLLKKGDNEIGNSKKQFNFPFGRPDPRWYFYILIIAPVTEELLFRGMLLPAIKYGLKAVNINPSLALIGSSLLFGWMHNEAKLPIAYDGYQWGKMTTSNNGSLWGSSAAHFTKNFITESVLFIERKYEP